MLENKDYCDYDTCVALEELGYNQYTSLRSYAGKGGVRLWDFDGEPDYKEGELIALSDMYDIPRDGNEVAAPSLCEAQKWLREEKRIEVLVLSKGMVGAPYDVQVYTEDYSISDDKEYSSYEDALSEGLRKAVEILKEE